VLPDSVRDRRWKADFTPFENDATRRDAERVAAMLTPHAACVRAGIVDPGARARLVAASTSTDDEYGPQAGWRLMDLVGLELWLQQYFGGRPAALADVAARVQV
jgi:hypothetical protein